MGYKFCLAVVLIVDVTVSHYIEIGGTVSSGGGWEVGSGEWGVGSGEWEVGSGEG